MELVRFQTRAIQRLVIRKEIDVIQEYCPCIIIIIIIIIYLELNPFWQVDEHYHAQEISCLSLNQNVQYRAHKRLLPAPNHGSAKSCHSFFF
jgi:hypothetical protein